MKNKILFIFISLFVLLIGVSKISAYTLYQDNNYGVFNERKLYNTLIELTPSFNIERWSNFYCISATETLYIHCYILRDVSSFPTGSGTNKVFLSEQSYYDFLISYDSNGNYTQTNSWKSSNSLYYYTYYKGTSYDSTGVLLSNVNFNSYSNFAINYVDNNGKSTSNVLDFSHVLEPEEPEPEDPIEDEYTIENKIYLPIELEENMCPYILDKDTIRVYDETPTQNSTVTYTDYFVNSHYISKSGSEAFENDVLMCLDKSKFTTAFYYRFDFDKIMIIFISMLTIVYVIFGKIIHSFFIGFRR